MQGSVLSTFVKQSWIEHKRSSIIVYEQFSCRKSLLGELVFGLVPNRQYSAMLMGDKSLSQVWSAAGIACKKEN